MGERLEPSHAIRLSAELFILGRGAAAARGAGADAGPFARAPLNAAELAEPLGPCWGRNSPPPPSCCQCWGVSLEQMGPQMKEAQQGAARAAFLLFNLSGCSSPSLPGLERDGGALQTLRAPSCKERRQWATALGGRAGGGPCVPLNEQVSRSSPGIDFLSLSAKDTSYCRVMMMRCPGDMRPCPCLLQPGLAGCGLCRGAVGRQEGGAGSLGDRSKGLRSPCASQRLRMLQRLSWELLGEQGWLLGSWG